MWSNHLQQNQPGILLKMKIPKLPSLNKNIQALLGEKIQIFNKLPKRFWWILDLGSYGKVVGVGGKAYSSTWISTRISLGLGGQILIQQVWGGDWDSAVPTSFPGYTGAACSKGLRCVCSSLLGIKAATLSPPRFPHIIYVGYYCGLWSNWYHQRQTVKQLAAQAVPPGRSWGDDQTYCWAWQGDNWVFLSLAVALSELPK